MCRDGRPLLLALASTLALVVPAGAQAPPAPERGTDLAVFVGAASSQAATGGVIAGIAGWQLTPLVAAEARAGWFDRERGSSAFAADVGALVRLSVREPVRPYVTAGFGLYRAAFGGGARPGSPFYRRRVGSDIVPAGGASFTDPAARLGAGLDLAAGRNVTIRPEVGALIVWRDGHRHTLGSFGVRIGYRFEDRPVTP